MCTAHSVAEKFGAYAPDWRTSFAKAQHGDVLDGWRAETQPSDRRHCVLADEGWCGARELVRRALLLQRIVVDVLRGVLTPMSSTCIPPRAAGGFPTL